MKFNEYFTDTRVLLIKGYIDSIGQRVNSIIELGCGEGNNIYFLRKHFPNANITGLDNSKEALEQAEKRYLYDPHIKFQLIDQKMVPGAVDLVFMNCVFQFIDLNEYQAIFQYLKAILKYNGMLAIYENNPFNFFTKNFVKKSAYSQNAILVDPYKLSSLVEKAGFQSPNLSFLFVFPQWLSFLIPTEKYLSHIPFGAQYSIYAIKNNS